VTVRLEFKILREGNKAKSSIVTMNFRRADFGLFRNLDKIPGETALKDKEDQESWLLPPLRHKNCPF